MATGFGRGYALRARLGIGHARMRQRWVYWMYDRPDIGICRFYHIPYRYKPNVSLHWNEDQTRVIREVTGGFVRGDYCLDADPHTGVVADPEYDGRYVPCAWTNKSLREAKAKGHLVPMIGFIKS